MKRIGQGSFEFETKPAVIAYAAVGGSKEQEGPLGSQFDRTFSDNLLGESSWEKAESRLVQEAVNLCIDKSGFTSHDFDMIFAGDLLNQCIASTFGLLSLKIPFLGMYGACSTMASGLITAAVYQECAAVQRCIASTSSHFSSSERQFRTPLQYGNQRTPTAQWTVTGSGAVAIGKRERGVRVSRATIGKMVDMGVKDVNNMGAAMAPADSVIGQKTAGGTFRASPLQTY